MSVWANKATTSTASLIFKSYGTERPCSGSFRNPSGGGGGKSAGSEVEQWGRSDGFGCHQLGCPVEWHGGAPYPRLRVRGDEQFGANVGERKWLPLGRIVSCGRQAGNHADSIYTERESAGMDLHTKSLEQFRDQRREALRVLVVPKQAVAIIAAGDDVIPTIRHKDPQRRLPSPQSAPNSTICQIIRRDPITLMELRPNLSKLQDSSRILMEMRAFSTSPEFPIFPTVVLQQST